MNKRRRKKSRNGKRKTILDQKYPVKVYVGGKYAGRSAHMPVFVGDAVLLLKF